MAVITKREHEIAQFLTQGYMDKEISIELSISVRTVQTYIERLMMKLCARNRLDLVAKYIREFDRKHKKKV